MKPKDLFDKVSIHIKKNDPLEYLEHLKEEAKWYAAITRKGTDRWNNKVNEILDAFKTIDLTHGIPLLLARAVKYGNNEDEFLRLAKSTLFFCIRYFTIGKNGVSNLEREIGINAKSITK